MTEFIAVVELDKHCAMEGAILKFCLVGHKVTKVRIKLMMLVNWAVKEAC